MRTQFAKICADVLKKDDKSVVLLGDISHFLLREAQKVAPNRFYNVGICEQAMVSMAAGMALQGMRPIVHTIAPFLAERAFEQIKIDIGYQKTDVTLVTVGGSYDYADLGCTHHCYGDVTLMRTIPGMQIYEPGTAREFQQLFEQTWGNGYPKYFRICAKPHTQTFDVRAGEINIVRESKDGSYVFVCGHFLDDVLENPDIGVLYTPTLSHFTFKTVGDITNLGICNGMHTHYCVENHLTNGGLADLVAETFDIPVRRIGLPCKFLTEYGSYEDLRVNAGLDKASILKKLYE